MNKQPSSPIMTRLCWGVFFLALLFLAFQVMPRALGQRDAASKPSVAQTKATVNLAAAGAQSAPASLAVPRRPNVSADSALDNVRSQPAGQPQSHPVPLPNQIEGIDCDSAPGIVIHDDGGIENGYSGNPGVVSEVRFADKFTPNSYPASYSSVCLDFVILPGGPATYLIDVVVFAHDGAGGAPGTLLGELNGRSATTHLFAGGGQPPIWNSYDISSLGINFTSGSVYIGTRYVPPSNNVFTSADESGPVGFAGGYWWNNFDGVWSPIQNAFAGYTSMFIRAVESGGGHPHPHPHQHQRPVTSGRKPPHTRRRSCVMASLRLPPTSMSSVGSIPTAPREHRQPHGSSPPECGNLAHQCPLAVKHLPVLSWNLPAWSIAQRVDTGSGFASYNIATDTWSSLASDTLGGGSLRLCIGCVQWQGVCSGRHYGASSTRCRYMT